MKNLLLLTALCLLLTSCDGAYTHYIRNANQEATYELRSPADSTFSLSVNHNVQLVPCKKRIIIGTEKENTGPILLTINGQEKKDFKVQHLINNGMHRYFLSKTGLKKGDSISLTWNAKTYNFVVLDSTRIAFNQNTWSKTKS